MKTVCNNAVSLKQGSSRAYMVMGRSWKVMEFEICIPGLEKSSGWKLETFVWVMEKSWNFRIFFSKTVCS